MESIKVQAPELVTITSREYEELLRYKMVFTTGTSLVKRQGSAYQKYKEMEDFLNYIKERVPVDYEFYRKNYLEKRKLMTYGEDI